MIYLILFGRCLLKNKLFLTQSVTEIENNHFRSKTTIMQKSGEQSINEIENNYFRLQTIVIHESGEQLISSVIVPAGHDPQKQGSALTYARRYGLSAFFAIATDHDDDANITIDEQPQKQSGRLDFKEVEKATENLNVEELNEYSKLLNREHPNLSDKQKEWLKHHFANRRRSIDQSFNNQSPINGIFGGDK